MLLGLYGTANKASLFMRNGSCSKQLPNKLFNATTTTKDGYPLYSSTVEVAGMKLDNRWVVPYNPYLLSKNNYCLYER